MKSGFTIGGYTFPNKEEYNIAKEDYRLIEYFKKETDLSDPSSVNKLYTRLVYRHTFQTILGYSFLKELQNILVSSNYRPHDQLEPIDVKGFVIQGESLDTIAAERYKELASQYEQKLKKSTIVNTILATTIIIMFIIALKADKTVFTQFEQDMIDKYSAWEEELVEWEERLTEMEKEIQENQE